MREHTPVLLKEAIKFLDPVPGKKYIDATLGMGGHTKEILKKGGMVLGIDQDGSVIPDLIRDPGLDSRLRGNDLKMAVGNFAELKTLADANGFADVDGILFDLGLGSHQLDDPARGFSFQKSGPLDMRFDSSLKPSPRRGRGGTGTPVGEGQTAADIINFYPEKDLIRIFYQFGEEKRFGKRIARAILERRKTGSLQTTAELFELIKRSLPGKLRFRASDTARKIFQALRIEVNGELVNLERGLQQALQLLKTGGRLVVISFHSLEDRIVKRFFVGESKDCVCPPSFPICVCKAHAALRILTKKPVLASPEELQINPRAQSAKMRVAERI